ncbi:MAG: hypothetical protein ABIX01_02435 [Chitinophagaceae bacterium]
MPTTAELYDLYIEAQKTWNYQILQRSRDEGFMPMIVRLSPPVAFEDLEEAMLQALAQ